MIGALCATLGAATHRFPWCRPAAFVGDLGALVGRGGPAGWYRRRGSATRFLISLPYRTPLPPNLLFRWSFRLDASHCGLSVCS